jgi:hypothetical protein
MNAIDRQNIADLARILRRWDDDPNFDDCSNTYAVQKRTLKRARVLIGFIEQGVKHDMAEEGSHDR